MVTREQGRRRTTAVTVGLAAASLAGTLAIAGVAYAEKADKSEPAGTTGGAPTSDQPDADQPPSDQSSDDDGGWGWQLPPGGLGRGGGGGPHAGSGGSS